MALQFDLLVHATNGGQTIWSTKKFETNEYASFYNSNLYRVPEELIVEIKSIGGNTYSYYTYLKGAINSQRISEYGGRSSSGYIALTLRINAVYLDVQNIFNILRATYDKSCVGTLVDETVSEGVNLISFKVKDFQSVDADLQTMESEIKKYILAFSDKSDLCSLSGFPVSTNQIAINHHECTKNVALKYMKQGATLRVSPWFNASKIQKHIDDVKKACEDKIASAERVAAERVATAQKQMDETRKACQQQLIQKDTEHNKLVDNLKSKHNLELSNLNAQLSRKDAECQNSLNELKKEYNNKLQVKESEIKTLKDNQNSKIEEAKQKVENDYRQKLERLQSENSKLEQEKKDLNQDKKSLEQSYQSLSVENNKLSRDIEQLKSKIEKLKKPESDDDGKAGGTDGGSNEGASKDTGGAKPEPKPTPKQWFKRFVEKIKGLFKRKKKAKPENNKPSKSKDGKKSTQQKPNKTTNDDKNK